MIDIKKDSKSDSFIITQTANIEGDDYHKQMTLNLMELSQLSFWFKWNYLDLTVGTTLKECLSELKERANKHFDWRPHTVIGDFNGYEITSDMSVDDAYKKVFGINYAEFCRKEQEERERWKSRLNTTKGRSCGR